jgi:hypothetical protein
VTVTHIVVSVLALLSIGSLLAAVYGFGAEAGYRRDGGYG